MNTFIKYNVNTATSSTSKCRLRLELSDKCNFTFSTDWATGAARFLGDPRVFCSPGATYVYGFFFPYGLRWCAVKRQKPFRNGHHLKGHMKCQSHWDVVVPLRSCDGPSEDDELIRPNMSLQSGTYISNEQNLMIGVTKEPRFWRGSNSRPSACKADVITTTPQNLL